MNDTAFSALLDWGGSVLVVVNLVRFVAHLFYRVA
jgi:hypothetical protein